MVDEATQKKISDFYESKNGVVEPTCEQFHRWKLGGNEVKKFRCHDAGENKKLDKMLNSKEWKLNVDFEYAPRDTPQHDYLAEVGFTALCSKGKALMFDANLPRKLRHVLFPEVFQTATKLDRLVVHEMNGVIKSRDEH